MGDILQILEGKMSPRTHTWGVLLLSALLGVGILFLYNG